MSPKINQTLTTIGPAYIKNRSKSVPKALFEGSAGRLDSQLEKFDFQLGNVDSQFEKFDSKLEIFDS